MTRLWFAAALLMLFSSTELRGEQCEVVCPSGYRGVCGVHTCSCKCGCTTPQQIKDFIKALEDQGYQVLPDGPGIGSSKGSDTLDSGVVGPAGILPLAGPAVDTMEAGDNKAAPTSGPPSSDEISPAPETSLPANPPPLKNE